MAFETVTAKAKVAFVRFVDGHGQIVGDPEAAIKEAREPGVPAHLVASWEAEGLIEGAGQAKAATKAAPAPTPETSTEQAP